MGAVDFLQKPFKQSVLLERIEAALEAEERRRETRRQKSAIVTRYRSLTDREQEIAVILTTNTVAVSTPRPQAIKTIAATSEASRIAVN